MQTILKVFLRVLLWLSVLFALIWIAGQIATKIWELSEIVIFLGRLLQLPPEFFVDTQAGTTIPTVLDRVYGLSYNVFFLASFIAGFAGVAVLSHGRTFPEIVWLFAAFILPKQRKYWGKVHDQATKKPIPFATLRLIEKDSGKFISQVISDLDGTYRITINDSSKEYILEVFVEGYNAQKIEIDHNNMQIINKNLVIDIGLDLQGKVREENLSTKWERLRVKLYRPTILFVFAMSIGSLVFGTYGMIYYPDSLPNQISLVLAITAVIWNISVTRQRFLLPSGSVVDVETHKPLGNVQLSIFGDDKQLLSSQTDASGIAKIGLPPGNYRAQITRPGYMLANAQEFIEIEINKNGYISDNILLKRIGDGDATNNDLLNPFS